MQSSGEKVKENSEGNTEVAQGTNLPERDDTAADVVEEEEHDSADCSPQQKDTSSVTDVRKISSVSTAPTPSLPYTEPHWSGTPSQSYYLTVIKSGSVVEEIGISNKPFQVIVCLQCIFKKLCLN